MPRPARGLATPLWLLLALSSTSCALVPPVRGTALFAGNVSVEGVDFDRDALYKPPAGFEPQAGNWAVAESPTAMSGGQVVVERGETSASLTVKKTERSQAVGGEVSLRVFLGDSGAGLACEAKERGPGYVLKIEPGNDRVVLYRLLADSVTPVSTARATISKGEWRRVGLRCENGSVIGYLDGKTVVRDRGSLGPVALALYSDGRVTAQFDDLKYWTRK